MITTLLVTLCVIGLLALDCERFICILSDVAHFIGRVFWHIWYAFLYRRHVSPLVQARLDYYVLRPDQPKPTDKGPMQ